jgi:hypothetical protein
VQNVKGAAYHAFQLLTLTTFFLTAAAVIL